MPLRDEDALEPGCVEHRGDANEAGTDLDPATLGVDRVGLDPRRAGLARRPDDAVEQRPGDPRRR